MNDLKRANNSPVADLLTEVRALREWEQNTYELCSDSRQAFNDIMVRLWSAAINVSTDALAEGLATCNAIRRGMGLKELELP